MTTNDRATQSFALFDTTIGQCGIVWGERGVVGVHLPETRQIQTRARLLRRFPDAREIHPPPNVQAVVDDITALLQGEPRDLTGVRLDMDRVPPFNRRVYEVARTIRPGETLTYGEIAARLGGESGLAREVGQALGQNPFPVVVPCHRVVAAGGKPGGFSAPGGTRTKLRMLAIEGMPINGVLPGFDE
jgi:methylated-DNA-[protein]-cysteine S-methyltransferase